ncbi:hypothetical protein B0H11DRAFT_2219140 [Mycena galericulata]|nr:hypothetical protein B0H11DRAFT_2219140 [Mycena galericulata]
MPSLDFQISEAIQTETQQLKIEWPVVSVEAWDSIAEADNRMKKDYLVDGQHFLSTSLKDFDRKRAFRGPVASDDVVRDAIFSVKTYSQLFKRAQIQLDPDCCVKKTFLLFVGVALKELGEECLSRWFAATFGPLIIIAQSAFINYYGLASSRKAKRRAADEPGHKSKKAKIVHGEPFLACMKGLESIRAKQPRVHRRGHPHNRVEAQCPGIMSKIVLSVSTFLTKDVPNFLSEALFAPQLVLPPGPFTAHADLALRMTARRQASLVPSATLFAPRLGFIPARLPSQARNADAIFDQIRETYDLLQVISGLDEAPSNTARSFASTATSFSLGRAATTGSAFTTYRDPSGIQPTTI